MHTVTNKVPDLGQALSTIQPHIEGDAWKVHSSIEAIRSNIQEKMKTFFNFLEEIPEFLLKQSAAIFTVSY